MTTPPKTTPYRIIERDLSWLYFNQRVLLEAQRPDIPLLERIKFLGIYSDNLDEFFRVRVASLRRLIDDTHVVSSKNRKAIVALLKRLYRLTDTLAAAFESTFDELLGLLAQEHIRVVNETQLTQAQGQYVLKYFLKHLSTLTIPFILNKDNLSAAQVDEAIYLAVELRKEESREGVERKQSVALIRLPQEGSRRFIVLPPDERGNTCVMFLDDLIRYNLPYIFSGLPYHSFKAYAFKFTKDAEIDLTEDAEAGVLQKVSKGVKKRKVGRMLRIAYDRDMPRYMRLRIFSKAGIDNRDARIPGGRYHNTRDLTHFPTCGRTDLLYPPMAPIPTPSALPSQSCIDRILSRDVLLHFPYQSFDRLLRLLREAAIAPDVQEIKISLYRLAPDSRVVHTLIAAAKNGKKVTAAIELMARFDEAGNVAWSKVMQEAGIKVLFGPERLKIHAKLLYLATRRGNIACVGTGNMHEGTAQVYTDVMLLTHSTSITREVNAVFNYIEKPYLTTRFKQLPVSPNDMRPRITALINQEIHNARKGLPAYIRVKMNHITDKKIIRRLYDASCAGVQIDLLVRGTCSVIPGIPGMSENIRLNAIIDRFLEHSRILIFANGGAPRYYIGSADWMERNLDRRIEVMVPVKDPLIQQELALIVSLGLQDVSHGHYVNCRNNAPRRLSSPQPATRSQYELYQYYTHREEEPQ